MVLLTSEAVNTAAGQGLVQLQTKLADNELPEQSALQAFLEALDEAALPAVVAAVVKSADHQISDEIRTAVEDDVVRAIKAFTDLDHIQVLVDATGFSPNAKTAVTETLQGDNFPSVLGGLIADMDRTHFQTLIGLREVSEVADAVDAQLNAVIPNATAGDVDHLLAVYKFSEEMKTAVLLKLQGDGGNNGLVSTLSAPSDFSALQTLRVLEEVTEAVDAQLVVAIGSATEGHVDTLLDLYKLENGSSVKEAVLEKLKGSEGIIADLNTQQHFEKLKKIRAAIAADDKDVLTAVDDEISDLIENATTGAIGDLLDVYSFDNGELLQGELNNKLAGVSNQPGLIAQLEKDNFSLLLEIRNTASVVVEDVDDRLLDLVPNTGKAYLYYLVQMRDIPKLTVAVDAKLLGSGSDGVISKSGDAEIDEIVDLMNLDGTGAEIDLVKDAAKTKFDELTTSVEDITRLINGAGAEDTITTLTELGVSKITEGSVSSANDLLTKMVDFSKLRKALGEYADTSSLDTSISNMLAKNKEHFKEPAQLAHLLNGLVDDDSKELFPMVSLNLEELPDMDGVTVKSETEAFLDGVKSVRRWKSETRCAPDAAETSACLDTSDPDYYVDVTADMKVGNEIAATFEKAFTLHADGEGLLEIKEMTSAEEKDSRVLLSKFLDQLIEDLLTAEERDDNDAPDLNDMTVAELMEEMTANCADGTESCDEQQANWEFFETMLAELVDANDSVDQSAIDEKDFSEVWGRMGLESDADIGQESLKAIKTEMNRLMVALKSDNGDGDGDDNGDAAETATDCCGC